MTRPWSKPHCWPPTWKVHHVTVLHLCLFFHNLPLLLHVKFLLKLHPGLLFWSHGVKVLR